MTLHPRLHTILKVLLGILSIFCFVVYLITPTNQDVVLVVLIFLLFISSELLSIDIKKLIVGSAVFLVIASIIRANEAIVTSSKLISLSYMLFALSVFKMLILQITKTYKFKKFKK